MVTGFMTGAPRSIKQISIFFNRTTNCFFACPQTDRDIDAKLIFCSHRNAIRNLKDVYGDDVDLT